VCGFDAGSPRDFVLGDGIELRAEVSFSTFQVAKSTAYAFLVARLP
jgi:hypothetical protein